MTKLQFTPQMFECCIRETVHIKAQKVYEAWLAEQTPAYICGGKDGYKTIHLASPIDATYKAYLVCVTEIEKD